MEESGELEAVRTLRYDTPTYQVITQASPSPDGLTLTVLVRPGGRYEVFVRHEGQDLHVSTDDHGYAQVDHVRPGLVSLRLFKARGEQPLLRTAWVRY